MPCSPAGLRPRHHSRIIPARSARSSADTRKIHGRPINSTRSTTVSYLAGDGVGEGKNVVAHRRENGVSREWRPIRPLNRGWIIDCRGQTRLSLIASERFLLPFWIRSLEIVGIFFRLDNQSNLHPFFRLCFKICIFMYIWQSTVIWEFVSISLLLLQVVSWIVLQWKLRTFCFIVFSLTVVQSEKLKGFEQENGGHLRDIVFHTS